MSLTFKKFHPAYAMPIKCFGCELRTTEATNLIEGVDQMGSHYFHVSCFKLAVGYEPAVDDADPDTLQDLEAWVNLATAYLPLTEPDEPPAPLSSIPESLREFTTAPEERLVPASDLIDIAKEVADKGLFTVIPFAHGKTQYGRQVTQCKVLIVWDKQS